MFDKINKYSEGISIGHMFVLTNIKDEPKNLPCWCKDYFQDYFWSQHVGKPIKVYGYECAPESLENYYRFYIKLGSKTVRKGDGYKTFELTDYQRNITTTFVRTVAEKLKIEPPYCGYKLKTNDFFIQFGKDWFKYPYLLSLLTSCIRIGTYISLDEFLNTKQEDLDTFMSLYVRDLQSGTYDAVQSKLKYLIEKGLPEINWDIYTENTVHDKSGIQSVIFK